MSANKKLKVTLTRSTIGARPDHKACVKGLGLGTKIGRTAVLNDDACVRGMINKVSHLVTVEAVTGGAAE